MVFTLMMKTFKELNNLVRIKYTMEWLNQNSTIVLDHMT